MDLFFNCIIFVRLSTLKWREQTNSGNVLIQAKVFQNTIHYLIQRIETVLTLNFRVS